MAKMQAMLDGYQDFYQQYFINNPETYQRLAKEGQSPKTLVISCSDSRVDPSTIFNTEPGDIFVIRNVANLVPPYEDDVETCHGTSAAIEYAVNCLEVENIIVLGHSDCGGIKTLLDEHSKCNTFIDRWLDIAQSVAHFHHDKSSKYCAACEKEAIRISIHNLLSFPFIKKKIDAGKLELNGLYFCLKTGTLESICKF